MPLGLWAWLRFVFILPVPGAHSGSLALLDSHSGLLGGLELGQRHWVPGPRGLLQPLLSLLHNEEEARNPYLQRRLAAGVGKQNSNPTQHQAVTPAGATQEPRLLSTQGSHCGRQGHRWGLGKPGGIPGKATSAVGPEKLPREGLV